MELDVMQFFATAKKKAIMSLCVCFQLQ